MAYTTADARQQLLDVLAGATDEIAHALAALGEAYELLDDHAGEILEAELFGPVQHAYGRAKRTHLEFADRYELPRHAFASQSAGLPSLGTKGFVEVAVAACARADGVLATLQDSMLPVDVGDADVRAGISEVRELLGGVRARARELLRTFGR
ncbi:MAG: hypothetical protein ABSG64_05335 [Solirubrobacteraceae bacterium]